MLTDAAIIRAKREARTATKARKLFDHAGLYILVKPAGSLLWRFKYYFHSRERLLGLGSYPAVSLSQARRRRDEARALVADGKDPVSERRKVVAAAKNLFSDVANEYVDQRRHKLAARTISKMEWQLREFVLPDLGNVPINTITPADLLRVLRRIEARGNVETAHKTKEFCGRIFLFGVATDRCDRNIAADLQGALTPRATKHYAAPTDPTQVGELLRAIDQYQGQPSTMAALKLLPHVFLRQGELRKSRWEMIDFKAAQWRLPGSIMKGKRDHIVPLSRQATKILQELRQHTGSDGWIVPAIGGRGRPISENTLRVALGIMGYSPDQITPHGFRTMASTLLHELGFVSTDIELQLSHVDKDKIRGTYNRSERIKDRAAMMQAWSDYLDDLKQSPDKIATSDHQPAHRCKNIDVRVGQDERLGM